MWQRKQNILNFRDIKGKTKEQRKCHWSYVDLYSGEPMLIYLIKIIQQLVRDNV